MFCGVVPWSINYFLNVSVESLLWADKSTLQCVLTWISLSHIPHTKPQFNVIVWLFSEHKDNSTTCHVIYEVESAGNHYSGYRLLSCDQGQSAEYTITVSHQSLADPKYVGVFCLLSNKYREKECCAQCQLHFFIRQLLVYQWLDEMHICPNGRNSIPDWHIRQACTMSDWIVLYILCC